MWVNDSNVPKLLRFGPAGHRILPVGRSMTSEARHFSHNCRALPPEPLCNTPKIVARPPGLRIRKVRSLTPVTISNSSCCRCLELGTTGGYADKALGGPEVDVDSN